MRYSRAKVEGAVRACSACHLRQHVPRPVPLRGPRRKLVVMGEAPGRDEAKRGKPFVGRAGKFLTRMLEAAGVDMEDVAFVNTVCCLPLTSPDPSTGKGPTIRRPNTDEQYACRHNWSMQLEHLQPAYGLVVGGSSLQLLRSDLRVSKVAGCILKRSRRRLIDPWAGAWTGDTVPIVVTYHPSYVLYNGGMESETAAEVLRHLRKLVRVMAVGDWYGEREEGCQECGAEDVTRCDGDGLLWCELHEQHRP